MHKRILSVALLLIIFLSACLPDLPTPTDEPITPPAVETGDVTPPETETPVSPIKEIPLHVGYGYQGPFYEIYFTDPTNPATKQQTGGIDQALIASIDSAHLSVDMAIYSLSLREIGNALLRARDRGVVVRVVMESDNRDRDVPQALIEGGIPVLGDRREGLMHDKFMVIDRSEVWTGSLNYTPTGTYSDNNNLVHIRSVKIAENYTTEFEEMYTNDLFGPDALAATPNPRVTVDGVPIETYFSPDDGVAARLEELLQGSLDSIYFMAYSFTSDPLGETIRGRAAAGVTVKGVMDDSQIKSNQGTEYDMFVQQGIDVRRDGNPGLMHHKVIIIDRSIVITGSYNFTASAENTNDENVVIFFSPEIAELYLAEFERVFAVAQQP